MATSVKIDDDLKNRVRQLANVKNRSPHWVMCEGIRDYVKREEIKEDFKQEALASWAAYQETGKHLTGGEVNNWLKAWGTEKETEAPSCHE
jgi:predicted transcriptional regulator